MTDIFGSGAPALVGGPFISFPTAPLKAFVHEVGAVQHPTSQELFDKMFRHQVEAERHIEAGLMYVGNSGLVAPLPAEVFAGLPRREASPSSPTSAAAASPLSQDAGATAETAGPSPAASSSVAIPISSVPLQHHHLSHATLLEENVLAARSALAQLLDPHGEHRTPMATNTVLLKKASERLTEARRIAMARGLVRQMNDAVDVKGNAQVVGEVNKVDVARIEKERAEILALMDGVKKRHEAFLNS